MSRNHIAATQPAYAQQMATYKEYMADKRAMILKRCEGDFDGLVQLINQFFDENACFPYFIDIVEQNPDKDISWLLCADFKDVPKSVTHWYPHLDRNIFAFRIITDGERQKDEPYSQTGLNITSWGELMDIASTWYDRCGVDASASVPIVSWRCSEEQIFFEVELRSLSTIDQENLTNTLNMKLAA